MEIEKLLEQLGLSKNETKTYLKLLSLGSVSAGPLIKQLGMHRAAVYNLLDMLIEKGLVTYTITSGVKSFQVKDPERLLEIISEQKKKLEQQEYQLKEAIPNLKKLRKVGAENQEGTIFKGEKGLKSIFEDILKYPKQEFKVMGASGRFKEIFDTYFIHWQNRRVKNKINLKIIYSEQIRKEQREKELKLAEIKYTQDTNITPSTTLIYGDKIAIIAWSEVLVAFLMRSEEVSNSYRNFFDILWKQAKK